MVIILTGCGGAAKHATSLSPAPIGPVVIISGADLALLVTHYPAMASRIYDSPNAYIIGSVGGHQDQVLPGSPAHPNLAHPTLAFTSYAAFRRDALDDAIDPVVNTVIYDPEDWSRTPARERRHPQLYIHRFIGLAHHAGFKAVVAPGRDLALAHATCHKRKGETLDAAYLRCRYAADAIDADMIILQTSADELTAGGLQKFLTKAVTQIRRAQPHVRLVGIISTQPTSHTKAWQKGLVRATRLELQSLSGFVLNFTSKTAPLAADYLRDAEKAGVLK